MSKIALQGDASGTGTFTIAAPNSNSNPTLTLPTSSGTVVVTGGAQTIEFAAGTAAAPSITFTGDTNTGIFSPAADTIAFAEGGVESMRIDSSGNVGIGVTSITNKLTSATSSANTFDFAQGTLNGGTNAPLVQFEVANNNTSITGATAGIVISAGGSGTAQYGLFVERTGATTGNFIIRSRNSNEVMRIESSGNVGIGVTPDTTFLGGTFRALVVGNGAGYGSFIGQTTATAAGTSVAYLSGSTTGASGYKGLGSVGIEIDGTSTTNATGRIVFYTGSGGSQPERARITSAGNFGIGTSTPGARFHVLNQTTITGRNLIGWIGGADSWNTNGYEELGVGFNGIRSIYTGGNNWALAFSTGTSTQFAAGTQSERARIDSNGYFYVNNMAVGGTANLHWSSSNGQFFVTSSSRRFKHDITDYDKGLAEVMQMQPKYFVYNEEPSQKQRVGFIAEDFHDLGMTEFVEYWKDENDQDTPSEIGYSNMVAILVKSIQELKAITDAQATRIEALEAEVAALKGQ